MTRTEHGMIAMPRNESAKLEAVYAIHFSNAIVARRRFDFEGARLHAEKTRALIAEHAKHKPFSLDTGRIYLRGGR